MSMFQKENKQEYCNIAWFRLQEATQKNEHERAFLNYRLLMYSYDDPIYKKEVKALLHYFFHEDNAAVKLFLEIIYDYIAINQYIKAMAIYQFLAANFSEQVFDGQALGVALESHLQYKKLFATSKEIV